ncbi:DUF6644 family protein [Steroidobacter sp.]|uniref:DUF6644 family protein n=1 Tax=Steroidobacter sp. TaxID=1978227 RepID=UPI001A4A95BF|nr:DUF6644 family protein [Steroidobacter sp.]MBL8266108.1 hypothetical protein [Steroidobacter sp.]
MFLYDFFVWLGETAIGRFLNESTAAFAATESLHIVALSLIGGVILVTHLRALGVTLKPIGAGEVSRTLQPVAYLSLVVVAISGLLLVAAGPFKYYTNPLFPVKLALLVAALISQRWLHRLVTRTDASPSVVRAVAASSLVLWTGVVITGRWLGLI